MKFVSIVATAAAIGSVAAAPTAPATGVPEYYLIRHAEKNSDGTISSQGMQRKQSPTI